MSSTFSLTLDIFTDHIHRRSTRAQQTETLTPEVFLPEPASDFGELLLQEPAAGTLIGIDEAAEFGCRFCPEHDMDMIRIMVPFFQDDTIPGTDIGKDLLCPLGNLVIEYFSPVFHHEDQMIVQQVY